MAFSHFGWTKTKRDCLRNRSRWTKEKSLIARRGTSVRLHLRVVSNCKLSRSADHCRRVQMMSAILLRKVSLMVLGRIAMESKMMRVLTRSLMMVLMMLLLVVNCFWDTNRIHMWSEGHAISNFYLSSRVDSGDLWAYLRPSVLDGYVGHRAYHAASWPLLQSKYRQAALQRTRPINGSERSNVCQVRQKRKASYH